MTQRNLTALTYGVNPALGEICTVEGERKAISPQLHDFIDQIRRNAVVNKSTSPPWQKGNQAF
jgi:hypothetical protein